MRRRLVLMVAGGLVLASSMAMAVPTPLGGWGWNLENLKQLDLNQDGKITISEVREQRGKQFETADTNKNGVLDHTELAALSRLGDHPIPIVGCRMDTDRNGVISKEEFLAAIPMPLQLLVLGKREAISLVEIKSSSFPYGNTPWMGNQGSWRHGYGPGRNHYSPIGWGPGGGMGGW